jgi:hypothetical protein
MLEIMFLGFFGKLSKKKGASAWFHGVWTYGVNGNKDIRFPFNQFFH